MQKSTETILTPQQRLAAYEWAKIQVNDRAGTLCGYLRIWLESNTEVEVRNLKSILSAFPELEKQKPDFLPFAPYWWPLNISGMMLRYEALNKAIELCNDQIKENGQSI